MKICIVCIEGLNRSGKTSHSEMLKKRLLDEGIYTEILIGDGTRPGIDNGSFYDPISPYWNEIGKEVFNLDDNNKYSKNIWSQAAAVLNKELYDYRYKVLPEILKKDTRYKTGIIILVRSSISRLFVLRQHYINVKYEDVKARYIIEPDYYLVLDSPKEVLLQRNENTFDKKSDFRRHIINNYYSLYFNTLNTLPIQLKKKITMIDTTPPIESVHEILYNLVVTITGSAKHKK